MAEEDKSSKTEEPTAKKLQEAYDQGDFAKAPEVAAAFTMAGSFMIFSFILPQKAALIKEFSIFIFSRLSEFAFTIEAINNGIQTLIKEGLLFFVPLFTSVVLATIVAGGLQTGFRISRKALDWKIEKLNPVKGLKNIFSMKKLTQFFVDLSKFAGVGVVLYFVINQVLADPIFHFPVAPSHILKFIYETYMFLMLCLVMLVGAIATAHLVYQKKTKWEEMKMSRKEIKDEFKNQEGDPMLKQARRDLARRLTQEKMLDSVPFADVVIANPTHFAVVLKYERGVDESPMITGKGKDRFAQRIKAIAKENGVPIVENKPVARLLFSMGVVGEAIPVELYQAIANILSTVYRTHRYYFHELKRKRQLRQLNG